MKIQEKVHPAPFFGREEKPLPSQQPTNSRNDLRKLTARKSKVFEVEDWHVEIIFRVFVSLGGETSKTFYFHPDPRKNDPIWLVCISNGLKTPTIRYCYCCKKKSKNKFTWMQKKDNTERIGNNKIISIKRQPDFLATNKFNSLTSRGRLKAVTGRYLSRYRAVQGFWS